MVWALRRRCPPLLPIKVRTTKRPGDCYGWCSLFTRGKSRLRLVIRLRVDAGDGRSRRVTTGELVDAVRHEWAHALALTMTCPDPHGPEWGVAYSRTYRATLDDPDRPVVSKRPRRTR